MKFCQKAKEFQYIELFESDLTMLAHDSSGRRQIIPDQRNLSKASCCCMPHDLDYGIWVLLFKIFMTPIYTNVYIRLPLLPQILWWLTCASVCLFVLEYRCYYYDNMTWYIWYSEYTVFSAEVSPYSN